MGPVVSKHCFSKPPFADVTDVTLADEDTNSILNDNANRAIQGNVAMNAMQCMWRQLVAKFATNASGAIWGPNLRLMHVVLLLNLIQVTESRSPLCPLAMFEV